MRPMVMVSGYLFALKLTQTVYIVNDIASKCEISHPLA